MNKSARRSGYHLICAFALLTVVISILPLHAGQTEEAAAIKKAEPIRISSDVMETENQPRLVIFKGNVVANRGDLTISSDELRIFNFQESGNMEKMAAKGNVRLKFKDRMATAEQAIYYNYEDKVELSGNAMAWEGDNRVSGDTMLIFLNEGKSIVKGNKDIRVNVVYYPNK